VSSITPNVGSVRGGTVVTVYGDGFRFEIYFNEISGSYFRLRFIINITVNACYSKITVKLSVNQFILHVKLPDNFRFSALGSVFKF